MNVDPRSSGSTVQIRPGSDYSMRFVQQSARGHPGAAFVPQEPAIAEFSASALATDREIAAAIEATIR